MSFVNVFQYVLISYNTLLICRRSSVVEHTLGKGGVGSSILLGGTIFNAIPLLISKEIFCVSILCQFFVTTGYTR